MRPVRVRGRGGDAVEFRPGKLGEGEHVIVVETFDHRGTKHIREARLTSVAVYRLASALAHRLHSRVIPGQRTREIPGTERTKRRARR